MVSLRCGVFGRFFEIFTHSFMVFTHFYSYFGFLLSPPHIILITWLKWLTSTTYLGYLSNFIHFFLNFNSVIYSYFVYFALTIFHFFYHSHFPHFLFVWQFSSHSTLFLTQFSLDSHFSFLISIKQKNIDHRQKWKHRKNRMQCRTYQKSC